MPFSTYQELQDSVARYMHRQDLTDDIKDFITLAESRLYRDVRAPEMIATVTLTATAALVNLPDDYIHLRELSYINSSGDSVLLTSTGREGLNQFRDSNQGQPAVYSLTGNDVEIAPDGTGIDFSLVHWRRLANLSDSLPDNAMLDRYPYLFLYGALIEGFTFVQDPDSLQIARENYVTEKDQVNEAAELQRFGSAPTMGANL